MLSERIGLLLVQSEAFHKELKELLEEKITLLD
jgi:hypothetical protein